MTIKALNNVGKVIKGSKVLIMGLTYKENVADIRETPVKEIIKELKEYSVDIYGYDPLLDDIEAEFGIKAYDFRLPTIDSRLHCHCEGEPKPRARRRGSDVAISMNSTNCVNSSNSIVCLIGLGYVGLPLAQALSKSFKVIGFDTDAKR